MEEDRPSSNTSLRAEELVTVVLERANRAVMKDLGHDDQMKTTKKVDHPGQNMDWASCRDFSVELGRKQIMEYISTGGLSPRWVLNLAFLETIQEEYHSLHRYRARLSIPTRQSPVPRDTASVCFTVRLSRFRPQTERVEVCYTLESNQLVHLAGKTAFREKWLEDLVHSKALLRRAVDF